MPEDTPVNPFPPDILRWYVARGRNKGLQVIGPYVTTEHDTSLLTNRLHAQGEGEGVMREWIVEALEDQTTSGKTLEVTTGGGQVMFSISATWEINKDLADAVKGVTDAAPILLYSVTGRLVNKDFPEVLAMDGLQPTIGRYINTDGLLPFAYDRNFKSFLSKNEALECARERLDDGGSYGHVIWPLEGGVIEGSLVGAIIHGHSNKVIELVVVTEFRVGETERKDTRGLIDPV
ncbi:uncharacterized protein K460DRAFT_354787 [Cucurbitaria berberidis CBS 394.84]|uniref:Uncharacterized protein n=1 Tax=Cucurbitaria berberidis CBS 394.84 TaxID=1168544 RepID=A0A9P4GFZ1_9PLEO|nr:uncharacterized protein K460DRAFT_354787 [Cucurbitaria berberidis CBS 394.84]KAF1844922.1 hypothetical protein K460DRAFT_354787 [Cucurbitaria berberidis CBS 394.84]